jgi:DNA-binding XRE family transcriptional regulator
MHVQYQAPEYLPGSTTLQRDVAGVRFEATVPALVIDDSPDEAIIEGDVIEDIELRIALWLCTNGRLSNSLQWVRRALGLTQSELGDLLGYRAETLSRWENGNGEPPAVVAAVLAGLLEDRLTGRGTTRERLERLAGPTADTNRVHLGSFHRVEGAVLKQIED